MKRFLILLITLCALAFTASDAKAQSSPCDNGQCRPRVKAQFAPHTTTQYKPLQPARNAVRYFRNERPARRFLKRLFCGRCR